MSSPIQQQWEESVLTLILKALGLVFPSGRLTCIGTRFCFERNKVECFESKGLVALRREIYFLRLEGFC